MRARLISLDYQVPVSDTSLNALPVLIGRGIDAGIRLDDHSVDNRHCEIYSVEGRLKVRDLGSVHGTFVNGSKVVNAELRLGDELAVGMLTFLVQPCEEDQGLSQLTPEAALVAAGV